MDVNTNIKILIQACLKGNEDGYKKLYQLYFPLAMSITRRYSEDSIEAEDMVNEGFIKVFKHLSSYDTKMKFEPWFSVIIIHACIDYIKKYKKVKFSDMEYISINDSSTGIEGLEQLYAEDILKQIQKLPPKYRLVFNLYAIEGYNHIEIAEKLGISIGGSKSNYSRAKKILREKLEVFKTIKSLKNEG